MKMDWREVINILYDLLTFLWLSLVYITESIVLSLIPRNLRRKDINGEVILVTGGAGGIGRLIAMKLSMLGAHVVIWDINESGTCFSYIIFILLCFYCNHRCITHSDHAVLRLKRVK